MFDEGLSYLSEVDFVVITGAENNVFFAADPLLAHTIGVTLENPAVLGMQTDYFDRDKNAGQLLLKFYGERDPDYRNANSLQDT